MAKIRPWEPFAGRWFGIFDVEGDSDSDDPLVMYPSEKIAEGEVARRRTLPEDDDDRLTEYHQVFPCDVIAAWWNSYDDEPGPLTAAQIAAIHAGEE